MDEWDFFPLDMMFDHTTYVCAKCVIFMELVARVVHIAHKLC